MKKIYILLSIFAIISFSCSKERAESLQPNGQDATSYSGGTNDKSSDTSKLAIAINGTPMQIDTFTFNRGTNTLDIAGINATTRVSLSVTNFWQQNFGNYICTIQVFYATRANIHSSWINAQIRNTDYDADFDDWMPMQDKSVTGNFSVKVSNDADLLNIQAVFVLLFN
jgi:hypothetical protein